MTHRENMRAVLEEFATTLETAGFRVYQPGLGWTFIGFAREVDGVACSGTAQDSPDGWQWRMNIVPSREWGSSMFLDDVPDGSPLTIENAEKATRLSAGNSVIPVRPNAGWPKHWDR